MKLLFGYTKIIALLALVLFSCTKPKEGCTDPEALNYDPAAKYNSRCTYGEKPTPITPPCVGDTCDPDSSQEAKFQKVEINIIPLVDGERLYLSKNYKDQQGRNLEFTLFKYFVSNVQVGTSTLEKYEITDVELIDYDTSTLFSETRKIYDHKIEGELVPGTYSTLYFGCGVDPVLNEEYRPNDYPAEHPLNTTFNGMDWTWEAKYKFLSLDGRIDIDSTGDYDRSFFYHTGFSELYRQVILQTGEFEVREGQTTYINLELDILKVFENIDLAGKQGQSHTSGPEQLEYSRTVQTNLANNIRFVGITYE